MSNRNNDQYINHFYIRCPNNDRKNVRKLNSVGYIEVLIGVLLESYDKVEVSIFHTLLTNFLL